MRREGWQHGTARLATGVECVVVNAHAKPTNHSKFTGKCRRARCTLCHLHPVSKSKEKAKGTFKFKHVDDVSKFSGVSASGILDRMARRDDEDGYDYDDEVIDDVDVDVEETEMKEDEEEDMGFCEVGFSCEYLDDWCLVHELM